jgi:hypothetical protein
LTETFLENFFKFLNFKIKESQDHFSPASGLVTYLKEMGDMSALIYHLLPKLAILRDFWYHVFEPYSSTIERAC